MKLMEELKSHSSKWIKSKGTGYENFYWQDGYGAFSYSQSQIDQVVKYIMNQKNHHKKKSFKEEYIDLLDKFKIKYEERFLFDWIQ